MRAGLATATFLLLRQLAPPLSRKRGCPIGPQQNMTRRGI